MAHKLKVGDHVRAPRTHNKAVFFTGRIVAVSEDHDIVTVETDASEGNVSREEQAHAADCQLVKHPHGHTEKK